MNKEILLGVFIFLSLTALFRFFILPKFISTPDEGSSLLHNLLWGVPFLFVFISAILFVEFIFDFFGIVPSNDD
ncbi:hypothetical protein [Halomonas llamarensis]|uniref:Uncharacterized protein n=1 Tax=Halomonas llamarensis TaxID=2945104 RepID=A0ABT0STD2_9GAMM|nr:hypothetical protein [Halomonas llamarensis]MCL7930876.1 hypothetical protein [Halomonas llamarensis]